MTVEKMSLSIPEELAEYIRFQAELEGMSASAWVARVVEHEMKIERDRRAVVEYQRRHGKFTEEELARARKVLWGED